MTWPCFYGIDFATRAELVATGLGVEEVRASIGADSLGYIYAGGDGRGDPSAARAPLHRVFHRRVPDPAAVGRAPREALAGGAAATPTAAPVVASVVTGLVTVDIDGVSVGAPPSAAPTP